MSNNDSSGKPVDALAVLLEGVASQDAAAMRSLYVQASPVLFGLALHIVRRREWAEEVLQDAFINIWRGAGDYRFRLSAPMAWMAAILRNRALDYLRQQKAFGAVAETQWREELDEIPPSTLPAPADLVLVSEEARALAMCMQQLSADQRGAIALAFFRDRTHQEIADALGAPLGTVKTWIRRGLDKLRTCIGDS
jgi:RNA polymerase sigma-70 factor, ECF subfamily